MLLTFATALAAATAKPPSAAETERWYAFSRTADAITGDLILAPRSITMSQQVFRTGAAQIVKKFKADFDPPLEAQVRLVQPSRNPLLLNGNHLCIAPVRWIATWKQADGKLGLSPFIGKKFPINVRDRASCGTFYYVDKP